MEMPKTGSPLAINKGELNNMRRCTVDIDRTQWVYWVPVALRPAPIPPRALRSFWCLP
jgi:hypothetical protein